MKIEIWKSDQNQEEIHHFVEGEQNTYLFGFNKQLLGEDAYNRVKKIVEEAYMWSKLTSRQAKL